jgi:hypothetical protein
LSYYVQDNTTGKRVSQHYNTEDKAVSFCSAANSNPGAGGRFGVKPASEEENPMPVWRKGAKAQDKGVPFRHTRDKALVLLGAATEGQLHEALFLLIDKRPDLALDILCQACNPDKS